MGPRRSPFPSLVCLSVVGKRWRFLFRDTIYVPKSFYRFGNDYSYTRRKGMNTELGVLFLVLRAGLWGLGHSSSAFKVALFSGKTRVRSVVPSFFFLGLYNEQGKVMFIVLVSQKSIRTSNDYRPKKSSESFKRKDRCWNRPYHFQRLALFLRVLRDFLSIEILLKSAWGGEKVKLLHWALSLNGILVAR